jgi:hypothetical protein
LRRILGTEGSSRGSFAEEAQKVRILTI